jgi:DNA-binding transcriptional regulator GbsR (MarR family)
MILPKELYGVANQMYGQVHNANKKGLKRSEILEKCGISISEFNKVVKYIKNVNIFWDVFTQKYYSKSFFPTYD